jgi:hypothetical protein
MPFEVLLVYNAPVILVEVTGVFLLKVLHPQIEGLVKLR